MQKIIERAKRLLANLASANTNAERVADLEEHVKAMQNVLRYQSDLLDQRRQCIEVLEQQKFWLERIDALNQRRIEELRAMAQAKAKVSCNCTDWANTGACQHVKRTQAGIERL